MWHRNLFILFPLYPNKSISDVLCVSFCSECLFRHHKNLQLKTEWPQRASGYLPSGLGGGRNGFHLYRFWTRCSWLSLNLQCSLPIAPIFTLVPALTPVRPGRLNLGHYIIHTAGSWSIGLFWVKNQDTWSDQDLFLIYKYIWTKAITSKPTYLHI